MCDHDDYVVAELVQPVKTPSEIQAEIQQMRTLNQLKELALRQQRREDSLRRQRVRDLQSIDVPLDLSGTPVERLLKAGMSATVISQSMPPAAAAIFIAEVIRTALQL